MDEGLRILLVEDNPADAHLFREAAKRAKGVFRIDWVDTGNAAVEYLAAQGEYEGKILPELVVLDLNMPGMDGREVLSHIKTDPKLLTIPVIVFTTSEADSDIMSCYEAHANSYVVKPVGLTPLCNLMETLDRYWAGSSRLPGRCGIPR